MKILVTGAFPLDGSRRSALEALGLELTFHGDEREMPPSPEQYQGAICNGLFAFQDIARFSRLKYIQLTSAGMDRVPLDVCWERGIQVFSAAGVYSVPMAEWTVMRLLELWKHAGGMWEKQKTARWEKDRLWQELAGKRVCILGYGAYGMETAKRLKAFDMEICCVNRTRKESPWVDQWGGLEDLHGCLARADAVILAVALTEQTRGILDEAAFAAMKPGAVLINAARGALVDERALTAALDSGKLAGAALDVFETEPLHPESPLWGRENVLISPHNSFIGDGNRERLTRLVVNNWKAVTRNDSENTGR